MMACSRKRGKALCFCVALREEGGSRRSEETAAAAEGERGDKRRELFVRLHSSSATAAAAASPVAYSPRRLISRLLLSFNRSSPLHNGAAAGGADGRKPNEERAAVETMPEEDGKLAAINPVSRKEKSDEQLSLNLGMGVGLVFLLTRSATEINKIVELRKQMEILLEDIKNGGGFNHHKNHFSSSASNSCRNQNISRCARDPENRTRRRLVMDQMEAELEVELGRLQFVPHQHRMELPAANAENFGGSFAETCEAYTESSSSQCGVSAHELRIKLNQLAETRQQQGIAELESSFYCPDHETSTEDSGEITELNDQEEEEEEEEDDDDDDDLELQRIRQRERITELESALESAQRRLRAKEREVCWWRDTAKFTSHPMNEPLFR